MKEKEEKPQQPELDEDSMKKYRELIKGLH